METDAIDQTIAACRDRGRCD